MVEIAGSDSQENASPRNRRVFVDPAAQEAFARTGYVLTPMLSPDEVAALLAAVEKLRPDDGFVPSRGPSYHCSFLDTNRAYRREVFDLISGCFAPHIAEQLAGFEILNCNFYIKPPGTGQFTVHQNWPAIADLDDTTVTIWCPLVDTSLENGAIEVVPGSQKLLPHVEAPGAPGYFTDFAEALIADHLRPVPMRAGDAIVFDDSLLHWSGANRSGRPRIAIQILCVPSDATPVMFLRESDDRFELVETDCEFFLENDAPELRQRKPEWRHIGYAPNRNRMLTLAEFEPLLGEARARRGCPPDLAGPVMRADRGPGTVMARIRSIFRGARAP